MTAALMFLLGLLTAAGIGLAWARLAGFAAQRPAEYRAGEVFDIRRELNGPILCEGVIFGPLGRVNSRFEARMDPVWDGNRCVMAERFRYDSGTTQDREWRLTLGNDGAIRAEADDVVGGGIGRQEGSAVRLRYRIRLPASAGGHVLSVTDWMYMTPSGTIVNRSQFRKFGIKVAELVATLRRAPA
ncbi:MAG: DUF3833 family protein [Paracoccaceae bacterium]